MPLKYPSHPGRSILRDCIKPLGMTVAEAAPKLAVTPEELTKVISCEAGITAHLAAGLGKVFGGGTDIWLRLQAAYDEARERNKNEVLQEPEPYIPTQERAIVPLKGGRAVYTTLDDCVLRFRYLQSGNTVFPWYGDGKYDQMQVRFGTQGPGALQVQLVHQPQPDAVPRLVGGAIFKAYLVWSPSPDDRPRARVDARDWDRQWSRLRAGRRLLRDLNAGLSNAAALPVYVAEEFEEEISEGEAAILKDAEALEKNYSKVINYMAFAGV